jgi:hypothetical protein
MTSVKDTTEDPVHMAKHDGEDGITLYDVRNQKAWIYAQRPVSIEAKR